MGALPKRKISKCRRNRRRAHDSLKKPEVVSCPKCGKPRRPHFECPSCGQLVKLYKRKLNSGMCLFLIGLFKLVTRHSNVGYKNNTSRSSPAEIYCSPDKSRKLAK